MYSDRAMLRALLPYLLIAALVVVAAAIAYGLGGPTWLIYAALLVAGITVLPGYERWENRHH